MNVDNFKMIIISQKTLNKLSTLKFEVTIYIFIYLKISFYY